MRKGYPHEFINNVVSFSFTNAFFSKLRHSGALREKRVVQSPDGFHRQGFAVEDDLATLFVLPVLEVARHVHPADCFSVGSFVSLADDEIDVDGLINPIFQVAVVFYVEDFPAVAPARPQEGIAARLTNCSRHRDHLQRAA